MNKKELIEEAKNEAIKILAVGMGLAIACFFISLGITFIIKYHWNFLFVLPLIIGYELARYIFVFLLKHDFIPQIKKELQK